MMTQDNWQARLLQIAREHAELTGDVGDLLRATIQQHEKQDRLLDVITAHGRVRETVITGVRMALRCGSLLLKMPPEELPGLLRAASISPQAAERYRVMAEKAGHELRQRCIRRRGKITEQEALHALRISLNPDPVTALLALDEVQS